MSFGQQSGPPASAKQLQYLLALLKKQGYEGFRDARGPLGLTQRQGNGKFSTKEASALIEQLLGEGEDATNDGEPRGGERAASAPAGSRTEPPVTAPAPTSSPLAGFPAGVLADELRRRGWTVTAPSAGSSTTD